MKNLIVANWKMNPVSQEEAKKLFDAVKEGVKGAKAEVVICPPFLYMGSLKGLILGAQDLFCEDKGAFTGEISCLMLRDLGIEYVIIGHSERRKYFAETDELINKKIKKALETGLKVIFCIGETIEERNAGKTDEVIKTQVVNGLAGIEDLANVNIAYEPVWAIGTGNNCPVDETKRVVSLVRSLVKKNIRVLYGASVKSENSGAYIRDAGANGLLVGGASLNAEEFVKIVKSAE